MIKVNKLNFILLLIILSGLGCAHIITQEEKNNWLQSKLQRSASIEIEGVWEEDMGLYGWGNGYFRQNGNKITGSFGGYEVEGIVSGDDVYVLFTYSGETEYVAHLNPLDGNLVGHYYTTLDLENGYDMILKGGKIKIADPKKQSAEEFLNQKPGIKRVLKRSE